MCTVNSDREVMVCDVSRDRVRGALVERLGTGVQVETVHGEGTRFACTDEARIPEFQAAVGDALGWQEDRWPAEH
jgi:hypothetical protein